MNPTEDETFRNLFYTHYPVVHRKLTALLRDEAAAEDMAQEVFLRLYRNPPDRPEAVGAWLHRVLTRIAYDAIDRKQRERRLLEKQGRQVQTEGNSEFAVDDEMLRRMNREEVQAWLDALPERDRQVLMLRYSGYSYAEIADQMKVSLPLVCTWIHRAQLKLKRQAEARPESV
ncbi:sigma-70 family RNA polymerase sigma factor [Paenibacillus sp. N4]|uniref:sigma-70 family RNA polymerase sigma factor n=1 Tax=Paenibacillus vietnamensis TaxID=2590547 RepID=UPI001CD118FE|nr:sigma-70 family RNA polymerase sigma factor [Paenibacillus vietnamensis]MCA0756988.1 sigma-70 family RNA polymerase sigma factor [Paenibacillus vietnamensis]